MKKEILKALKSIENVSILKGPVKKNSKEAPGDEEGHGTGTQSTGSQSTAGESYECILLIKGQLLPVTFHSGDNVQETIAEACKRWKISFMP